MLSLFYKKIGEYLKDAVYAANDGIITTFAVVAGVVGASLEPIVILVLGFANLFADGMSMASGNYLGSRSEEDLYKKEKTDNLRLLHADPLLYKRRVGEFLERKGVRLEDIAGLAEAIIHNENFAAEFIIGEELGLTEQKAGRPIKGAIVTLAAFIAAGFIPLVPYVFLSNLTAEFAFLYASLFTGIALFGIGAIRFVFMNRSWFSAGIEMLLIGGLAAFVAYGVGFIIKQII